MNDYNNESKEKTINKLKRKSKILTEVILLFFIVFLILMPTAMCIYSSLLCIN
jgi:hypothetical protein